MNEPTPGRVLTPPEIVCSTCGETVECFGVLDDDNRSAVWWEHLTEPEDDHDVTFPGPRECGVDYDHPGVIERVVSLEGATAPVCTECGERLDR